MLTTAFDVALSVLGAPVLVASLYLGALAILSRNSIAPRNVRPRHRFDVLVPAHDEETGIEETIRSLLAVEYPRDLRRIVVVADNCSDHTADRARAVGAEVIVRDEPSRRGKGWALRLAFDRSLADGFADAVVVVDADSVVSPNLLRAFDARLASGATAIQAHYGVANPDASWRTRLMAIAFCLFHKVRSLGRETLRLSAGLRGNGMCFTTRLLREVPHDAVSVVEDVEYGIRLGEAGHRVHYAAEAEVLGEMAASERSSRSQRRRWEGGRRELAYLHAPRLLRAALVYRDRVLLDLALDLIVPPLTVVAVTSLAGFATAAVASHFTGTVLAALWVWGASAACVAVYVARGWWLSGTGLRGLGDLLHAPAYVLWKIVLHLRRGGQAPAAAAWIRTTRESEVR